MATTIVVDNHGRTMIKKQQLHKTFPLPRKRTKGINGSKCFCQAQEMLKFFYFSSKTENLENNTMALKIIIIFQILYSLALETTLQLGEMKRVKKKDLTKKFSKPRKKKL